MMEAVYTSETSVYYNETRQHNIPEGYHLQLIRSFGFGIVSSKEYRKCGNYNWKNR
jgi:hypothetical protein